MTPSKRERDTPANVFRSRDLPTPISYRWPRWACTCTALNEPISSPTASARCCPTPLPDPFAEELVIVPAKGVERWLSQRLSHMLGRGDGHDGVCAGISFRNPRSLIAEITGTVDDDPWSPDAMVWPLLEVIDCSLDEPWCRTLATHLGHFETGEEKELRQGRRYAVARRLAGLFASYARQRPQLLVDWERDIAGDIDSDLRLAAAAVAGAVGASRRRPASRSAHQNTCAAAAVTDRPAGTPVPVRAHPTARHRGRAAQCPGHPPRSPPLAAAPQRRPVAEARGRARRYPATRRHQPSQRRTTHCWPPSAATYASSSAACPPTRRPTNTSVAVRIPTRCSAGCSPTSPPTRSVRTAERCAMTTGPSRCTAATARPARSTCSGRFCSACSPTTPRWNRATSW